MKNYISISDVDNLQDLVASAFDCKANPFKDKKMGENKTIGLIFMNASLRTRLSTQIAVKNLGLDCLVMNISGEGYALETDFGVVMDGNKPEHIKEAAGVIGRYCDMIAIRCFPLLQDRDADYQETILNAFMKYAGKPIISLEGTTTHPLQSLTDIMTIREFCPKPRPKVVLTWAPHPKALPQSTANSFSLYMCHSDVDFVITNPEGFDLAEAFRPNVPVIHDQTLAFKGADIIYAKNWSSYENYGATSQDKSWMVTAEKMELTNNALFMHCLPVRRNVVVADEVIDSPNSITIDEAANRVWAAQAVIKQILLDNF